MMDLYQEIILDHSKNPQHAGLREPFDEQVYHVNTSCGDEITLRVLLGKPNRVGGAGQVVDVSYQATGCSIMSASTSIMAGLVVGQELETAGAVYADIKAMLTSKGTIAGEEQIIGDAVALAGVARYPARVKCALLPWAALADALARRSHVLAGQHSM